MFYLSTMVNRPEIGSPICELIDIGEYGHEIIFGKGRHAFRMFLIRLGDNGVRAYVNLCPHYSLPLNHQADRFLTRARDRIMCRQHLALFALEDGACLGGACEGVGLTPVPVELRKGTVFAA